MSDILLSKIVGVNFNQPTFKMVGGLGIDDVKIKYNWFLQAEVKDAIIGEDSNGLVWYSGLWICGTWEGGTWYSGTWYNGRWKMGNWYSYDIDKSQMMEGKLKINAINISKSQFLGGTWESGKFHYGIFGHTKIKDNKPIPYEVTLDFIINNNIDYPLSGETNYYDPNGLTLVDTGLTLTQANEFKSPIFIGGDFLNGWMNASIFQNGNFYNGFLNNSMWYNGIFYNGVLLGDIWFNGNFYGGDFSNGIWKNGLLSTYKKEIISRFGTNYKPQCGNVTGATWESGQFINGQFHSSLNLINDLPIESEDHSISKWYGGTFTNGLWYGGTFKNGTWVNGTFYGGIIENISWQNGYIKNCVWQNGTFINGTIGGGMFNNMTFINGDIGNDI